MTWTKLDYLYRDADNHKAFGSVALMGDADAQRWNAAIACFKDGNCFIAEQLAMPSLCQQLFRWSGDAPTDADHCWHEYLAHSVMRESTPPIDMFVFGPVDDYLDRIFGVESWDIWLSPNVVSY